MSHATVRSMAGSANAIDPEPLLAGLPDLVNTATTGYVDLLERGLKMSRAMFSGSQALFRIPDSCCSVPTRECPPHCVAEIEWDGCGCEAQRAVISVKNTSREDREYTFSAGSLGPAKVEVAPAKASLAPGESVTLNVTAQGSDAYEPGETYTGELLVRGAYEQCVILKRRISPQAVARLTIEQGDIPERITELQWYRHWQCVEPCPQTKPWSRDPAKPEQRPHT
ncbi:MAG TPA: hypothetical protein VFK00_09500 [Rhodanobacteraceae bacterium]|jgi:hypothetical protein|nr:hypothetical protein [Rhodanobacteraceae bacterium]